MFRFPIPGVLFAGVSARMAHLPSPGGLVSLILFLSAAGISFSEDMEIVVSASRIEEDARSDPSYVRIIPSEILTRVDGVLEALKILPDIGIRTNAPGKSSISMSGFGENGYARTLVLVDGRPVNRADMASVNWQLFSLDEILHIEVIKGPLSSQYGDQAIAGAVNIITRKPEGFETSIYTNLSTGLTNRESLRIVWGGDVFSVQGSFCRIDLNPSRKRSDFDTISTGLKLGADFRHLDLGLNGFFAKSSYQLPGALSENEYRNNPDKANKKEDQVSETIWMSEFNLETSIGPLTLTFPISWRHLSSEADVISDTWNFFIDSILDDVRGSIQTDIEIYLNDRVMLVPIAGIDVNWTEITVAACSEKGRLSRNSKESAKRRDLALRLRLKTMLGEHWVADAGMRFAAYKIAGAGKDVRYMPLVYDFGGVWMPTEHWTARLRYGRVFRYPMLDEQVSYFSSPSSINTDLKPEFGHHVIGSLGYAKNIYRADMAAYFIAMRDEIVFNSADSKNANIGDTQHMGAVFSVSRTGPVLGVSGSYALDFARHNNSGKRVPLVPLHSIYGRVSLVPIEPLTISTDTRFTSRYYKGGDNDNRKEAVKGRLSWDARIDWRPVDNLSIYAKVANLLDDRTPTEVYWQSYSDKESWYPIEGREFSFGALWRY
ncbi:hypothetical protein S1OALGB6SA_809 [Olavius algarvensis spirochete endosymbiont]|uniref:TonB-dependent receptor n=1 Tax=Olavius algarvensis spirochete endosymbiont TaxID=260710 RepID=UPI000F0FF5AC|nr:TonB-dependent receptor [Olavius algarvensis spirochete endosymbiont]VDA99736.1 hypothetical protein S1OALGB6SA_809 [Olavius algarvensis spirochete endosymbiont]